MNHTCPTCGHVLLRGAVPHAGDFALDFDNHVALTPDGRERVALTPAMVRVLRLLTGTPNKVFTYKEVSLAMNGMEHTDHGTNARTVMKRIRIKLRLPVDVDIVCRRGLGYIYEPVR